MPNSSFETIIIGAGLAGICLAQHLKRNGIGVTVHERHNHRTYLSEGFWIELNDEGTGSLRECLSPEHFETLMAITRPTNRPDCRWLPRAVLQKCLLQDLEGIVQFDRNFTHYEEGADGRVAAIFADAACEVADVLIAADGVHSRVRPQLLPHAKRIDTGVLAIGGTAELSAEIIRVLPPRAFEYPIAVKGPDNRQMFIAVWRAPAPERFPAGSRADGARAASDNVEVEHHPAGKVMWRFAALGSDYCLRQAPEELAPSGLKASVLDMITAWSPPLRRLVELIDPATIFPLPIRTCIPIEHWTTGPVTLVGDAIHGMAPYGGFGANTAMRDAAVLGRSLAAARRGEKTILQAIYDYEIEMVRYGFDAARRSMHILQQANQMNPLPLP
jgi:2-polyprenyl-6-methoxyphenol hydroxylase-like FAD-dependent oxidoreductase